MGLKYKVNQKYFEKWSPAMSYLLGYLYADGNVEEWPQFRAKYLQAISSDIELIEFMKKELRAEHNITIVKPQQDKHRIKYRLRIGDPVLYSSLKKHGLQPRKSLTMRLPAIPDHLFNHFLRGYFDGDGCIYIEKQNKKPKRLRLIFTSGSREFLEAICLRLGTDLSLKQNKVYKSRRSYQLSYSTNDSLKVLPYIYKNSTGSRLKRRYEAFAKTIEKWDNWKVKMATWRSS